MGELMHLKRGAEKNPDFEGANQVKYVPKELLLILNRAFNPQGAEHTESKIVHMKAHSFPVLRHQLHNDTDIRMTLQMDRNGGFDYWDVPIWIFNALPLMLVNTLSGTVICLVGEQEAVGEVKKKLTGTSVADPLFKVTSIFPDGATTSAEGEQGSAPEKNDGEEEESEEDQEEPEIEEVSAYQCDSCDYIGEDAGESAAYECGNCGTQFNRAGSKSGDNHQCPDCGKFGSKRANHCCPECDEGALEEITGYRVVDTEEIFESEAEAIQAAREE